ncbi:phage late control D family protein [Cytobacillus sp. IB215665]|uniref:phage late control D family protein n=1 Tax=Cytobacillus sp. IB215665 TaxID=3097357 RepID=UPI002A1068E4|nr:contractile injection system protein, VgrG/Pvc8 family [Cytobacillus sp. IB215665]MDX8367787.1 contractile injection system protein, VgrG/Pvc8 family [Cytobacillus sp. IB215665]
MNSRRTYLDITYNKHNITEDLSENLIDWTFTDNLSGQIDDISLTLEDTEHKWLGDWFPTKGSLLEGIICKENWKEQVIKTKIGKFELDEIDASGEPSEVVIKALSVPESSSIRGEEKSKAWEKTTLKVVAGDIASQNGLKLYFEANDNPKKDRYEQLSETDLAFLHRLCNDEGLCLKLSNQAIVILDEADYENKDPVATINRRSKESDEIQVKHWSARTTLSGTYKACRVQYSDSSKKKTIKTTFTPPKAPKVGRTLVVKEQVKSVAEGQRLAKKRLREKNKNATLVNLVVTSTKHLDAGVTVTLKEFGKFDGKYIITQSINSQNSVQLALRRCLEGY